MSNKYPEFSKLSQELQDLLISVKDSQVNGVHEGGRRGHYDERGYYAEYDCENCKPRLHTTIIEAQELSWLDIHEDSDWAYEKEEGHYETMTVENDDGEEEEYEEWVEDFVSGVCFITIKEEHLKDIPNFDEDWY